MGLSRASIWRLQAASYRRHELHTRPRAWGESNCYVDLCIEVLHAAGFEPTACLGFTLASDFEGDQFTFFKPPPGDLQRLYGVSIYELNLWRPLLDHALTQLDRGALLLAEVDSYYLPDTTGTDYRQAHTKTTIGIESVDREARRLGYFHNAGYFSLEGADFDGLFQLEPRVPETHLPPYVELLRASRGSAPSQPELVERSVQLAREHLSRRPQDNPVARYRAQLAADVEWLVRGELATFHQYAFSVLRQLGANFELLGLYLEWLGQNGVPGTSEPAQAFDLISQTSKAMIMKLARSVNAKRPSDLGGMLGDAEGAWERGMQGVVSALA
ncbi:MAG TPA: DUF1839 family protein [Polyangiales bacterium]|nr:DUF1839 family protein [Polyangiales bacterium]